MRAVLSAEPPACPCAGGRAAALKQSAQAGRNPHILNLGPPLNLNPKWFKHHTAYTMPITHSVKPYFDMSRFRIMYAASVDVEIAGVFAAMAEEFRADCIAVNGLWPRTIIHTAALAARISGVRQRLGSTIDLARYAVVPGTKNLLPDLFVD